MENMEIKSTVELKHINQRSVYNYVYKAGVASRLDIANRTGLSFPTVATNIQTLLNQGLIENCGEQKSTGGRKALAYRINAKAAVAFGVEILKESIQIAVVDLYGTILGEEALEMPFVNENTYYKALGDFVNAFCDSYKELGRPLGVSLAIQGLISPDGESIAYSKILNCTGVKRDKFQEYIKQPCILVHDTDASALAESRDDESLSYCVYIALNRNFGGTIIHRGLMERDGFAINPTIEHMCIDPDGPECYCGNKGCAETLCSANLIKAQSGMRIPDFFDALHSGDEKCMEIWNRFVSNLSILINNLRMLFSCQFILGGYMAEYMNDKDFDDIYRASEARLFDKRYELHMKPGRFGDKAPKLGAALVLVESYLKEL